jgi:hypothetical protein
MSSLAWLMLALFAGSFVPNHSLGLSDRALRGARPSGVVAVPSTTRRPLDSSTAAPGGVQGGGPS